MPNLSIIQSFLPSAEEQVELLEELLRFSNEKELMNFKDTNWYSYNWLTSREGIEYKDITKGGLITRLDKYQYSEENILVKEYIRFMSENVLYKLALGIITQCREYNTTEVSIFKPEALLDIFGQTYIYIFGQTYISVRQEGEDIELIGVVAIYFNN